MPSNAKLSKKAHEIAEKLGTPIETDGLTSKELSDLLSDLSAKAKDAEHKTQTDEIPAAPDKYVVAKGKALTTLAGIKSEGDEVHPKHFYMGKDAFDHLRKTGYIVAAE